MSAYPPFGLGHPGTELRRQLVDETVDDWREAHERFFGRAIGPETEIVALRFRVVVTLA